MIAARVQVGVGLGVAAVALVLGLVLARGPGRGDALERFAREQQHQRSQVQEEAWVADQPVAIDDRVVISVPLDGDVTVSGQAVSDADLDSLLRAAFVRDPDTQVVLEADTDAPHSRIVAIMERAKAAGLTRLAIGSGGTDP